MKAAKTFILNIVFNVPLLAGGLILGIAEIAWLEGNPNVYRPLFIVALALGLLTLSGIIVFPKDRPNIAALALVWVTMSQTMYCAALLIVSLHGHEIWLRGKVRLGLIVAIILFLSGNYIIQYTQWGKRNVPKRWLWLF
ncbi:MAG: hypothetical protein ACRETC_06140 [Gammaproteobacteria bacterium]